MEERRGRLKVPPPLHVEIKTVDVNVTALALEAGLPVGVAKGPELLAFTALLVDVVMTQTGHVKAGEGKASPN